MSRAQRVLVIVALPGLAIVLHVLLCEWQQGVITGQEPALTPIIAKDTTNPSLAGIGRRRYDGLFAEGVSRSVGVLGGIVSPVVLVLVAGYLALGWPRAARLRRGACPECGYDLRGDGDRPGDRCPECGWVRGGSGAVGPLSRDPRSTLM